MNGGNSSVSYSIIQGGHPGTGNLNADPIFVNAAGGDLHLQACSPAIDAGTSSGAPATDLEGLARVDAIGGGGNVDIGAHEFQTVSPLSDGTRWYVNAALSIGGNGTTWACAFKDLQLALAAADAGDEIWVAAGTYKPTTGTDRNVSFVMKNGVQILGGFPDTGDPTLADRNWTANVTTLSGDIDNDNLLDIENSNHVVFSNGLNSSSVLEGVTISGGFAANLYDSYGGGMLNLSSSPTVTNCIFSGHLAEYGGGMYNDGGSNPIVTNCTFSGNSVIYGGGMFNHSSSPQVTNCSFSGNTSSYGGGMYNNSYSSPQVTNCTFSGNSANSLGGGMFNNTSAPSVTNCWFFGNSAGENSLGGGGMYNLASSSQVTNCSFFGNSAANGRAIYNSAGGNTTLVNSILWDSGSEIGNNGSNPTVSYSIVQGGYTPCSNCPGGDGNVDPQFVSTTDLHLQTTSPALDAGNDAANSTTLDLDGNPRKVNLLPNTPQIDLGAYELQSLGCTLDALCHATLTAPLDGAGIAAVSAASLNNGSTGCGTLTFSIGGQPSVNFGCAQIGTPQTVTLTVTDDNGSATCQTTLTVEDNLPPNALCRDFVKNLDANGTASVTEAEVNNLSNDNCGTVNLVSALPNSFTCSTLGAQTVTLTVNDGNGNTATCEGTVTVQDNSAPTALCNATLSVNLNASGTASITVGQVNNGSSDNCGLGTLSISPSSFGCANVGTQTVTLTVPDVNGNSSTCTTSVTVADNIAPTALCNATLSVNLGSNGTVVITPGQVNNGSSDNCGLGTLSVSPGSFTCQNIGNQTVTLTVPDLNGNSSTCTTSVTVSDITPPTVVCQPITVNLGGSGSVSISGAQIDGGSTDNCGIASRTASPNTFTTSNLGANNVTLTVTDNNSLSATCTAVVTVVNTNAPNAVCQPYTAVLGTNGTVGITAANVDGGSTAVGGIASMSVSPNSFTCSDLGGNTVTLTVVGNNGEQATCQTTVTVVDNTPPTVACQNSTAVLSAAGTAVITPSQVLNTTLSSDNCGTVNAASLSLNSFTCSNLGANTVTLTANDGNGNAATCTATVTVSDATAPTLVCQNISVSLGANGTSGITPVQMLNAGASSDNCGTVNSVSVTPNSFTCSTLGGNQVTLTANDSNGNTATCTATVTVQDNAAPTALCRDVVVQLDPQGNGSITASQVNNGSFDNCALGTLSVSPNSFTLSDLGINPVTLTVPDVNGNSSTCTADVTVENNQLPNAICQNISRSLDANGQINLTATDVDGGSTALGGIASRTVTPNLLTCSNLDANTITLTVLGNNGQQASCNATVMVSDVTLPTAVCKNISVSLDGNGSAGIAPAQVNDGSTDNCGTVNLVSVSPNSFACSDLGGNVVTLTLNDGNGNNASCTATVTVQDNSLPTVVCKNHVVGLDENGEAGIVPTDVFQSGSDNCGTVNLVNVIPNSFTCSDLGGNTVTLTVNDGHGNQKTCTATVSVVDDSDPTGMCQNITRNLNANGQMSIAPADVFGGGDDNCGTVTPVSVSPNSFTCNNLGANTVTLTIGDGNGNNVTCTASVTVQDIMQPSVVCKNHTVNLDGNGQAGIAPVAVFQSGSDNCGTVNLVSVVPNLFDCSDLGGNQVTLTVDDGNGNSKTCTASVTVQDNLVPTVVCKNHTVVLDGNGEAGIVPADVFDSGSDNCGTVSLVNVMPNSFDCNDLGGNPVTLTVTDGHGNFALCAANVLVQDNTPPVALCKNATLQLSASGTVNLGTAMVNDGTSDNCSFSLSLSHTSFNCSQVGENQVVLTAVDPSENAHSCTATVTFEDNLPPTALCKTATVYLDADGLASVTTAQVNNNSSDNCGIAGMDVSPNSFTCNDLGANSVTLTVTDVNENSDDCTATVHVVGNLPQTVVCQNISIQLDANANANISPAQVLDAAASGDNCGTMNLVNVLPNQFDCGEIGDNVVILSANDGHGNTATCTATVTVEDFFTNTTVVVTHENCGMSDGSIVVTTDAPGGQVAFSINGGVSWQFSGTFDNLPAAVYVVMIQAYGSMGCSSDPMQTEVQSNGSPQTWYKDMDGDGHSDGLTQLGCVCPGSGWMLENQLVATSGDCNDYDDDEFPGQVWYRDMDDDEWSNGVTLTQCERPWGYKTEDETATDGDCDDTRNYCYPGATELCNNLDDDCDGEVDEGVGGLTYVGNVTFTTQAQVNNWSQCYTVIQGNLMIQNAGIDSLASLQNLVKVTGNVTIKVTGLDSLSWLMNLDTIGGTLNVNSNSQLYMLHGLDSLKRVGDDLKVFNNQQLTQCCAIYELFHSPTGIGGSNSIFSNETGCDSEAEIDAECEENYGGGGGSQNLVLPPNGGCDDCVLPTAAEKWSLSVEPNPNEGSFRIRLSGEQAVGELYLYDAFGRLVWRQKTGTETSDYRFDEQVVFLRKGAYLLVFQHENGVRRTQQVVVH